MVEVSPTASVRAMELITILNRCHRFRGFVYQQAHFSADRKSGERRFEFIPDHGRSRMVDLIPG